MVDLTSTNSSTRTFHEFWGWIHGATNVDEVMKVSVLWSGINCFPVTLKRCTHTSKLQSNTTTHFHFGIAQPSSVPTPVFYNLYFYYQSPPSKSNISTHDKFNLVSGSLPKLCKVIFSNSLCSCCTLEAKRRLIKLHVAYMCAGRLVNLQGCLG